MQGTLAHKVLLNLGGVPDSPILFCDIKKYHIYTIDICKNRPDQIM